MDELERRLRDAMSRAVDGWTPTPGTDEVTSSATAVKAKRRRRPLIVVLASLLVLVVTGTGIGLGVSGGSHAGNDKVTLGQDPTATATPPDDASGTASPTATPSGTPPPSASSTPFVPAAGSPTPTAPAAPGSSASTTDITTDPVYGSDATDAPTGTATKAPAGSSELPACSSATTTVTVTTDRSTYVHAQQIVVKASLKASVTCQLTGTPYFSVRTQGGATVFGPCGSVTNGEYASGSPCSAPVAVDEVAKAGQSVSFESQTWGQTTSQLGNVGSDKRELAAAYIPVQQGGTAYSLVVGWGSLSSTTAVTIQPAPACTSAGMLTNVKLDQSSYAQGGTATVLTSDLNESGGSCEVDLSKAVQPPVVTDASGNVVWSSGAKDGSAYPVTCDCPGTGDVLYPVLDDQEVPTGVDDQGRAYYDEGATVGGGNWDLTADGSAGHPQPSQLGPGTYTITWSGGWDFSQENPGYVANNKFSNTFTFTITGTGATTSPSP